MQYSELSNNCQDNTNNRGNILRMNKLHEIYLQAVNESARTKSSLTMEIIENAIHGLSNHGKITLTNFIETLINSGQLADMALKLDPSDRSKYAALLWDDYTKDNNSRHQKNIIELEPKEKDTINNIIINISQFSEPASPPLSYNAVLRFVNELIINY